MIYVVFTLWFLGALLAGVFLEALNRLKIPVKQYTISDKVFFGSIWPLMIIIALIMEGFKYARKYRGA